MFAVSTQASLFPQEHKQDDMDFVLDLPFTMNKNRLHALQTKYTLNMSYQITFYLCHLQITILRYPMI